MTDTTEAVRLEFERYFLESRKSKGTNRKPTFERFEDGTYKDDHTQRHWWTWQNALLCRIPAIETARDVAVELAAQYAAERDQLRAELEKVRVPEGWKLVPVEPTREMWAAVNKLDDEMAAGGYDGKGCSIEQAWNCLLDFVPTPPMQIRKAQHEPARHTDT